MNIELYPLDRILIDGVSICFGMKRSDVENTIGRGEPIGNRYYYYNNDMAIDYDNESQVEFVEFLGGMDGALRPVIYGVSAFDTLADELAELLKKRNQGDVNDTERGYSLSFLNISVGVYRQTRPEDVAEMIEEMKADGIPTEGNEDIAEEERKANHWAAIGVGVENYYRR